MARLATTGWELNEAIVNQAGAIGVGDPTSSVSTSVASVVTSPVRSGTYAGQIVRLSTDADAASWACKTSNVAVSTTYFSRFYFQTTALPSTASLRLALISTALTSVQVRLTTGGKLQCWDATASQIGSDSVATIQPNTWYRVEVGFSTNGSTQQATGTLLLDGVQVATGATTLTTASGAVELDVGVVGSLASGNAMTLTFDDLAINDSTGASQTSWPGDGKVVLLKPVSDNAKGTGWTNDAASSTSLFPSVDNTPPAGVADTTVGTGLHQIRNATSNASVNYDANLTTYSAAGIAAADTVNVLAPIVATAAPVTTSSKQGTVGVSANPVIANVALGAGGTAGAFWSGIAGGTYSTGWKWSAGTTTYAPSVTLGSAPVMRITQVTASTRIAMVCAMGMYVDYTPAVVIPPTPLVHQSIPFYPRASRPS